MPFDHGSIALTICPLSAPLPDDAMVTMAYVPFQQHPVLYDDTMAGLCAGTIFPELDKPFIGGGAER